MSEYWNRWFAKGGHIWGDMPSRTVLLAHGLFQKETVRRILIPGSGYGRHAAFFAARGYEVTGVEISDEAAQLAEEAHGEFRTVCGSILDVSFDEGSFDGIHCFNVLHLFRESDRRELVARCLNWLKPGGLAFFVVFSDEEATFGMGEQTEKNTFETKPGRPVHYFSEQDLRDHFAELDIIDAGLLEDPEDHGEKGSHVHILRYISAKSMKKGTGYLF